MKGEERRVEVTRMADPTVFRAHCTRALGFLTLSLLSRYLASHTILTIQPLHHDL